MTARARALTPRRARVLEAVAEALAPGATAAGVPERIAAALADASPDVRARFGSALTTIETGAIATRYVRPFTMLGPAARAGVIARMRRARVWRVRSAAQLVASACLNQFAAIPTVERDLGFSYACVTDDPPRAGERLEVLSYPQIYRPHVEECDVVVVGSGAGGAVAAAHLAEAGMSVVVVEEGSLHTRADVAGTPVERARRLYRDWGATTTTGTPDVRIPLGMGLGGTTLVSYGSMYRPPDEVLAAWEALGIPGIDATALRPYLDDVERVYAVTTPEDGLLGPAVGMVREAARASSLHGGAIRRSIDGCRGCGTCSVGCPSDAKLSTALTYLPRAQQRGATLYANARVERIVIEDGRAAGVAASLLDPRSRRPKTTLTVRAPRVIIACGALHTPRLLAANALGNTSGRLGRGLSLMPTATLTGFFDERILPWAGMQQGYAIDEWLSDHGVMLEVTAPLPGIDAGGLPGSGDRARAMIERLPHAVAIDVTAADEGTGAVGASASYRLPAEVHARLVQGIVRAGELLFAAGARAVLPSFAPTTITTQAALADLRTSPIRTGLVSRAPSGTAAMGRDPGTSVVDPWGAVHGVPGVTVVDASVLPGCPRVAPQLLIGALAARSVERLVRDERA